MEYSLGLILYPFLFLSLANINDTVDFFSPCTNKSLENGIPAISFCKDSIAASNVAIVLDGYYAHSLTNVTTCTCVARSQVGQTFIFSHAPFGNGIGVLSQTCASEIRVSNSKRVGFMMFCSTFGSLIVDDNGEITMVLRKIQTTADTRYCLLAKLESGANFSITCEGHYTDVPETLPSVQTTTTQSLPTTPQTTTSFSVPSSSVSDDRSQQTSTSGVTSSPKNKLTTGLIVSTVIGWCFGFVFVVTTLILLYQRRNYMTMMKEKTYDELHSRDARNYSTIVENNIGGQEYEIVTGNI